MLLEDPTMTLGDYDIQDGDELQLVWHMGGGGYVEDAEASITKRDAAAVRLQAARRRQLARRALEDDATSAFSALSIEPTTDGSNAAASARETP